MEQVCRGLHFVEVCYFCNVHEIDDGIVFDLFCNPIQDFIKLHTRGIPIMSKSDYLNKICFNSKY